MNCNIIRSSKRRALIVVNRLQHTNSAEYKSALEPELFPSTDTIHKVDGLQVNIPALDISTIEEQEVFLAEDGSCQAIYELIELQENLEEAASTKLCTDEDNTFINLIWLQEDENESQKNNVDKGVNTPNPSKNNDDRHIIHDLNKTSKNLNLTTKELIRKRLLTNARLYTQLNPPIKKQCKRKWHLNLSNKFKPWSEEEDKQLKDHVHQHGLHNWSTVAKQLGRTSHQCGVRWHKHLNFEGDKKILDSYPPKEDK